MNNIDLINKMIMFVKEKLNDVEGGYDWFYIECVYKNVLLIVKNIDCDFIVV